MANQTSRSELHGSESKAPKPDLRSGIGSGRSARRCQTNRTSQDQRRAVIRRASRTPIRYQPGHSEMGTSPKQIRNGEEEARHNEPVGPGAAGCPERPDRKAPRHLVAQKEA